MGTTYLCCVTFPLLLRTTGIEDAFKTYRNQSIASESTTSTSMLPLSTSNSHSKVLRRIDDVFLFNMTSKDTVHEIPVSDFQIQLNKENPCDTIYGISKNTVVDFGCRTWVFFKMMIMLMTSSSSTSKDAMADPELKKVDDNNAMLDNANSNNKSKSNNMSVFGKLFDYLEILRYKLKHTYDQRKSRLTKESIIILIFFASSGVCIAVTTLFSFHMYLGMLTI